MNAILKLSESPREQWLAARCLGSSDAATICGLNKYKTPYQLFMEKTGALDPEPENEAMTWGKKLEPLIAQAFSDATGLALEKCDVMSAHPEHSFLTATPDYITVKGGHLVEIKNKSFWVGQDWEDGADDSTLLQAHHQMLVTGARACYVVALVGGNHLVHHKIDRDEDVCQWLIKIESEFWQRIQDGNPPEFKAPDTDLLNDIFQGGNPDILDLPDACAPLIDEHQRAKKIAKEAEEKADIAAAKIKAVMEDHETARLGQHYVNWKTVVSTRLDTKLLKAEQPEIYKTFGNESKTRRFEIKTAKPKKGDV